MIDISASPCVSFSRALAVVDTGFPVHGECPGRPARHVRSTGHHGHELGVLDSFVVEKLGCAVAPQGGVLVAPVIPAQMFDYYYEAVLNKNV